jgi:hypothetical protein
MVRFHDVHDEFEPSQSFRALRLTAMIAAIPFVPDQPDWSRAVGHTIQSALHRRMEGLNRRANEQPMVLLFDGRECDFDM